MKIEVTAGNMGTVYNGDNMRVANRHYRALVTCSKAQIGRAAGESVMMMKDGEPVKEFVGAVDKRGE